MKENESHRREEIVLSVLRRWLMRNSSESQLLLPFCCIFYVMKTIRTLSLRMAMDWLLGKGKMNFPRMEYISIFITRTRERDGE